MKREDITVLPWPIVTLDFEASSLTDRSYPIEVGVSRWSGPDMPIMWWSTIILPHPDWMRSADWSLQAQEVHGIRREELAGGMKAHLVIGRLDDIVRDSLAFCDGGINDSFWMRRLSQAAGRSPDFALGDLDALMISLPPHMQQRAETWLSRNPVEHRAGADALRHMNMIAAAMGASPDGPIEIHV